MSSADRRIQRTRIALRRALTELLHDYRYDTITIQDITERANVGRTTFYLHFASKDDLLLACHANMADRFQLGLSTPLSREMLLASAPPPDMTIAYQHLDEVRDALGRLFLGQAGHTLLSSLREQNAQAIETNLVAVFSDVRSTIPLDVLATSLAGTQLTLLHWWLEKRQPHSAATLAQTFHRIRRAVICDAFGIVCERE